MRGFFLWVRPAGRTHLEGVDGVSVSEFKYWLKMKVRDLMRAGRGRSLARTIKDLNPAAGMDQLLPAHRN